MPFRHTRLTGPVPAPRWRRAGALAVAVAAFAVVLAACGEPDPPPPPPPTTTTTTVAPATCGPPPGSGPTSVRVMGPCPRLDADLIIWWFGASSRAPYNATVPIADLVRMFLEEGRAEGVRGDIAFAQSIVETGWFSFPGRVPAWANNFSGFGATDGTSDFGIFPDARTGVRAQIQHLRRYADPGATSCTMPPLRNPCVNPRFSYVVPSGRAPTWNQFGSGNWATDPGYAAKVLNIYSSMLAMGGLSLA